jgi:hypothetical protein
VVAIIIIAGLVGLYVMGTGTQWAAGLATGFGAAGRSEPASPTSTTAEVSTILLT